MLKTILYRLIYFSYSLFSSKQLRRLLLAITLRIDTPSINYSRKIMNDFHSISIGKYSYGCYKVDGSIAKHTKIGAFCSIAHGVRIGGMNHPMNYVSTHPFLYLENRKFIANDIKKIYDLGNIPVTIEDDVWIGQNAIILVGINIGKGSIIGAGAVVTKDIPPYAIAVGAPAKIIKFRFPEDMIEKLIKVDWCSWEDRRIKKCIDDFYDIDIFVSKQQAVNTVTHKAEIL